MPELAKKTYLLQECYAIRIVETIGNEKFEIDYVINFIEIFNEP